MKQQKEIQEVIDAEQRWVQAHRDLDLDAINDILSEDYTQIRSDGSIANKADTLASYASGTRYWSVAESDQYQVKIMGSIALLIGRWEGRGENAGTPFDYTARFMSIYKKTPGGWRLVADHSTPIDGVF
jgi:ketosteroid isomerase-like protein